MQLILARIHLFIQKEKNNINRFVQNLNDHRLTEINFLREEKKEKKYG